MDFITSHIRPYQEEPLWWWWHTLRHPTQFIPVYLCLRSFNPIFRISNAAVEFLHNAQLDKWQGHNEILFPTLLFLQGFKIADFGGSGPFVLPGMENKFYYDDGPDFNGKKETGHMRHNVSFHQSEFVKNKLFHPIKASV